MNYIVIKTVRKRPTPSMYSLSIVNALQWYKFSSDTTLTRTEEIDGTSYVMTWVLLPDGYWIPFEYRDDTFVMEDLEIVQTTSYVVIKTVRKRPEPSMYSLSTMNALQGFKFSSDTTLTKIEEIAGVNHTITWALLPDGYWIPFEYKNDTFVMEDLDEEIPETPSGDGTLLPPFETPSSGRIFRFLRDEELASHNYRSRVVAKNYKKGALPATVMLDGKPDFVPLTRPFQELWFECLKWQAGGTMTHDELIDAWKDATMHSRALNDQHAWDFPHEYRGIQYAGYHDYILGVNINARDVSQRRLSMAGNIGLALTKGNKVSFKAIDLSKPAPKIETIWGNHTLVWFATETNRPNWWDGGRVDVTGRWPQLGKLGVPYLNVSPTGINYVANTKIAYIGNNVSFSPYKP